MAPSTLPFPAAGALAGLLGAAAAASRGSGSTAQAEWLNLEADWTDREAEYAARLQEFDTEARVRAATRQLAALDGSETLDLAQARRKTARAAGSFRASVGRSGVALDAGSTAQAETDLLAQGEWEVALIRYGAAVKRQELGLDRDLAAVRGAMTASMARSLGQYRASTRRMDAREAERQARDQDAARYAGAGSALLGSLF